MASIPAILPTSVASGIWTGAQKKSAILAVTNVRPQKFGNVKFMRLTAPPKAEIVGAGAAKGASGGTLAALDVPPIKVHATIRADEELKWADEDHQLQALEDLAAALEGALAEQIDLAVIHRVSALQGTVVSTLPSGLAAVTTKLEITDPTKVNTYLTQAAGTVLGAGYTPTGAVLDPTFAFAAATETDTTGRPLNPDFPLTGAVDNHRGLRVGVSQAVSGRTVMADSKLRGVVGDYGALALGLMRDIPVKMIEYGDPDGLGDLQRHNQIALRGEMSFGFGVFADAAFAKIVDEVA